MRRRNAGRRPASASGRAASGTPAGRSSATEAMAASTTSGRSTMPAPPPNGVSSTVRWRSVAKSRMLTASSDQMSDCSARPASECASGPGNISGNSVSTEARQAMRAQPASRTSAGDVHGGRRHDHDAAGRHIDLRHAGAGERQQQRLAAFLLDLQTCAGAVVMDGADRAEARAIGIERMQPDQVRQIELVFLRLRQLRPIDIEPRIGQRLGRRRGRPPSPRRRQPVRRSRQRPRRASAARNAARSRRSAGRYAVRSSA